MKSLVTIILGSLIALPAMADLQTGLFRGTDATGAACEVFVDTVWFENLEKHPLNERVTVKFENLYWDLAHPSVVDEAKGTVRFDHSYFRQIVPVVTPTRGAHMVTMYIDHDAKPHAPKQIVFVDDNYADATKSRKVVCDGLVHVP